MNEREIFLNAVDLPDEASRVRYLRETCGDDNALRQRIEDLILATLQADDFLEDSPPGLSLMLQADDSATWEDWHNEVNLDFLGLNEKEGCLGTLGQYDVVGIVGRGAFGIVLRAFDTRLARVVAIKVLTPELASNKMAVKRFLREAQAAAAVRHDHVITIYAIEESHSPPFIVMEFVDGHPLSEIVDRDGCLELSEVLRIGKQAAAGLAAAHEQGLVHRDIKPANILLESSIKRVKITDFGLARAVDDVGITQTGIIAGTPQYMSPEQGLGEPIDGRSDQFSLGAVLYTLCTGRSPFRADSAVATLRRVCDDEPRPISEINPALPAWLEQIVMRMLQKEASHRFTSAREVEDVLGACLAHVQLEGGHERLPAQVSEMLPEKTLANNGSGAGRWPKAYPVLTMLQLVATCISYCLAFLEIESIVFTGPVFGLGLGAVIAGVANYVGRGWRGIGFGLSSIVMSAFVFLVIAIGNLSPMDEAPILVAITFYVLVVGLWGIYELLRYPRISEVARVGANKTRDFLPWLLGLQVLGVAGAAANAALELESLLANGPIFGLFLGISLAMIAIVHSESLFAKVFAVSVPLFSLFCFFAILGFGRMGLATFSESGVVIVRLIVAFAMFAVPLGFYGLLEELQLVDWTTRHLRFDLRSAFAGMLGISFAFAGARVCHAFSFEAFLAGFLFILTLLSMSCVVAVRFVPQKQPQRGLAWFATGIVTMTVILSFMGFVAYYDQATAMGYVEVDTQEPVKLLVQHHRTGDRVVRSVQDSTDLLGLTEHGLISVSVVDRDDLDVVPRPLKVLRGTPVRLRVIPRPGSTLVE